MIQKGTAYRRWTIPKKSGGQREIQAAHAPLRGIQARIAGLLYPSSLSPISYGYIRGKTHRQAAEAHLEARAFYTFDIQDAFPSTSKSLVRTALLNCGFDRNMTELMAELVCFTPPDKTRGQLPQGYASSPVIFNVVLRPIDQILASFARDHGYTVTRYVDNFGLSTKEGSIPEEDRKFCRRTVEVLSNRNFKVPPEKTSYWEQNSCKEAIYFEFLGLAVTETAGKRTLRMAEEKTASYEQRLEQALATRDFSKETFLKLSSRIRYARSVTTHALPARVEALWHEYCTLRILFQAQQKGQLAWNQLF